MGERVKGKVVAVIGAGSIGPGIGNGKAAAIVYAREGARVLAVDDNLKAAEETRDLIEAESGDCIVFRADISSASECRGVIKKCIDTFGRIDILHLNNTVNHPPQILEDENERPRPITQNLRFTGFIQGGDGVFINKKFLFPLIFL